MAAFKNKTNGTWYVQFRYTDWKGERQQKLKRGFATKKEAQAWEREFLMQKQADVNMTFESFAQLYEKDMKPKLKLNTWLTKESIIQKKILPYFGKRKLSEITAKDVMDWQNVIRGLTDAKGKPYSPTYLKTVHNQLSALFNHAVRYYGLQVNPAAKAGNMGVEERREMLFWTKEEYLKFADAMMDKPLSYYAFEMLYWCGIREGELLALTPTDFDFEAGTVSISKSYQRLKGKDVITTPKTKKSNRVIKMPKFLCGEMEDYLKMFYSAGADERIFPVSKHYLHHEMDRGAKAAGVKRIRIHDLRHSHIPSPGRSGSSIRIRPIASDRVKGSLSGWGWPRLMVRLPCGSPSISSTFRPACASPIPRLAQVVVLPTPPFWLAMAMICVFNDFTSFLIGVVMCLHSSPGNDKSRHLKQVTASPKSNILLCLKSKGFEFLSAIHLSLMKHLL